MAMRILKPLVRWGGYYPSKKYTPFVYPGGYTTMNAAIGPLDPLNTFSGDIVRFTTKRGLPMQSVKVNMSPVQDLHGYDSPWPAGGGKNLFPLPTTAETKSGVTVEATTSGEIWVHGTPTIASGYIAFELPQITSAIIGQQATISINEKIVGIGFDTNIGGGLLTFTMGDTVTVKTGVASSVSGVAYVNVRYDVGTIDKKFKIQLEIGNTATAFAPFANICPISGWTGCSAYRTGKNLFDKTKAVLYSNVPRFIKYGVDNYADTLPNGDCVLDVGTYTFSISGDGTEAPTSMAAYDSSGNRLAVIYNNKILTFTTTSAGACYLTINFPDAVTWADYNIQLESGSTATDYEEFKGNSYSVTWGDEAGTVYGGTVDLVSGKLIIDTAFIGLGTLSYTYYPDYNTFVVFLEDKAVGEAPNYGKGMVCSAYPTSEFIWYSGYKPDISIGGTDGKGIAIKDSRYTDVPTFKAAMSGVQLAYPLETPIELTITPTPITALFGYNNVWSNAGPVEVVAYGTPIEEPDVEPLGALGLLLGGAYHNDHTPDDVSDEEALDILLGGADR